MKTKNCISNEFSNKSTDTSENVGSKNESDNSSIKVFMGNLNDFVSNSNSNCSNPTVSEDQHDNYSEIHYEYDYEGESDFEDVVRKRDE